MRHLLDWGATLTEQTTSVANHAKALASSAVAVVTLCGLAVGGIVWVHTVKTDTDRALVAIGKLETRMDEQTAANRALSESMLKLTFSVDALAKAFAAPR